MYPGYQAPASAVGTGEDLEPAAVAEYQVEWIVLVEFSFKESIKGPAVRITVQEAGYEFSTGPCAWIQWCSGAQVSDRAEPAVSPYAEPGAPGLFIASSQDVRVIRPIVHRA